MPGDVVDYLTDGANWSGPTGIGTFLVQQLLLTVTALAVAIIIGLPFALYAGHRRRGGFLAINVSNVGRAVPVFAVLLVLSLGPIGSEHFGPYGRAGLFQFYPKQSAKDTCSDLRLPDIKHFVR